MRAPSRSARPPTAELGSLAGDLVQRSELGCWSVSSSWIDYAGESRLTELRAACNITLEEFAAKLGVEPQELALWEAGGVTPAQHMQERMAEMFAVSVEWLMGRVGLPPRLGR